MRDACGTGFPTCNNFPVVRRSVVATAVPHTIRIGDQAIVAFDLSDIGPAARVALRGRLDAAGVAQIEQKLLAEIASSAKHTVVDLAGVSFISSLGIRMLLGAAETLKPVRASLVLYGAQPLVAESLNLVVKQLLALVGDESQALALLAERDADRK